MAHLNTQFVSRVGKSSRANAFKLFQYRSILGQALGLSMLLNGVSAYADVDSNTGALGQSTTTSVVAPSNMVHIHGFSFTPEHGTYDLKIVFTAAEMLWLNKLKLDSTFATKAGNGPLLIPVAAFDICVDSNLEVYASSGVQLKASVAAGDFTGAADSTNNKIPSYVLLHGNGAADASANAAAQDLLFGTAASTVQGFMNTTAITQANKTLVTGTASTYNAAFADGNTPWVRDGVSAIDLSSTGAKINGSTATAIDHYGIKGADYALTTVANDTTNSAFQVDVTGFEDNKCGTGNVGVINAVVYLDVRSLIGMPADTYTASIGIDFSIA